jgi:flagellar motor switch protein FliN
MEENKTEDQSILDKDAGNAVSIKSVQFSQLKSENPSAGSRNVNTIDMLMDIHIPILVELGKTEMVMRDVLSLLPGSIIELDDLAGEPVKITVRGKVIAYGEVVVVDENFGVKITKIANPQDRIKDLGGDRS